MTMISKRGTVRRGLGCSLGLVMLVGLCPHSALGAEFAALPVGAVAAPVNLFDPAAISEMDYSGNVIDVRRVEPAGDVIWRFNDAPLEIPVAWGDLKTISGDGGTFGVAASFAAAPIRLATSLTSVHVMPSPGDFVVNLSLSGDGDTLAVVTVDEIDPVSHVWTLGSGFEMLLPLGVVSDVAEDALTLVGSTGEGCSQTHCTGAARWTTDSDGGPYTHERLFLSGPGSNSSDATAVSPSGEYTVGFRRPAGDRRGFVWTEAGGIQLNLLGLVEEDGVSPRAVSDTGRVVGAVESSIFAPDTDRTAVIWDGTATPLIVADYLIAAGLELELEGWTLHTADRISSDGTIIAGTGTSPDGEFRVWRAVLIPEPSSLLIATLGLLGLIVHRRCQTT